MPLALPVRIAGLGHYLPKRVVTTEEVAARLGVDATDLAAKTGVRERRFADRRGLETASAMGARAATEALEDAGVEPSEIDLVINASGTVEQSIPDGGALLQRALGWGRSGVPCFSVHGTCLSFLAAIQLVAPAIALGRHRRVLVVSSDIASAGIDWDDPESAALFGDGAAAAVLTPSGDEPGAVLATHYATYGHDAELAQIEGGGTRHHPRDEDIDPRQNLFQMQGPRLLRRVLGRGRAFLDELLADTPEDVNERAVVIPHQASLAGLKLLSALGFPEDRTVSILTTTGNCVAASIPLALHHAERSGRLRRGELALLVGTGAGLSMGGVLLRF